MKQKILLLTCICMFFASCGEDHITDPSPSKNEKEVVFQFPGISSGSVVPYTRGAIATENENKLVTLDIYVFKGTDDDAVLERIYHSKEGDDGSENVFTITQNGDVESAKIAVPTSDENKAKIFFFVGNGRNIISLNTAKENVTKLGDFKDFKVNALTSDTHIAPPLLMTDVKEIPDITALSGAQEVNLFRRMARFDIVNVGRDSNFEIEEILIFGARPSTRIFKNASAKDDTPTISMEAINFKDMTDANQGTVPSVFYIYPTLNTASDGSCETELTLVGKVNGTSTQQVYPVKFALISDSDPNDINHLTIAENHRYIIEILKSGISDLEATLRVEEWQEGEEVKTPVEPGTIRVLDENGQVIPENIISVDQAGATLKFMVEATSKWGVDNVAESWLAVSGVDDTNVGTEFTLTVEANTGDPRSYILYVRNAVEKSILQTRYYPAKLRSRE